MGARAVVTILGPGGQPVGRIDPAAAEAAGGPFVTVLDESERERVERVAGHLARRRSARPEGGCVTQAPAPRV